MTVQEVIEKLEQLYPLSAAESWDNVGLLIGDKNKIVKKIYVTLDVDDTAVKEAVDAGVDLIVSHHPLLFSAVKKINTDQFITSRIVKLLEHGISCYAAHTNYDTVRMGDLAAAMIGLEEVQILEVTGGSILYKLAVYVPEASAEKVRQVLGEAGAGAIGNYSHCTFGAEGTGTFLPGADISPYIGRSGEMQRVHEVKIETVVPDVLLSKVLHKLIEVHPYEEPAYDIWKLEQKGEVSGYGRSGRLKESLVLAKCAELVKKRFSLDHVRVFGELDTLVRKVAICPGAGKSAMESALQSGAEVYVTGDISYHEGIDLKAQGMAVIDAGHYGLEHIFIKDVAECLREQFPELKITEARISNPLQVV